MKFNSGKFVRVAMVLMWIYIGLSVISNVCREFTLRSEADQEYRRLSQAAIAATQKISAQRKKLEALTDAVDSQAKELQGEINSINGGKSDRSMVAGVEDRLAEIRAESAQVRHMWVLFGQSTQAMLSEMEKRNMADAIPAEQYLYCQLVDCQDLGVIGHLNVLDRDDKLLKEVKLWVESHG